jgi:hypothetical protein
MRKFMNIINEGLQAPQPQHKYLRIYRAMHEIIGLDISTPDGVTRMFEKLHYLCDAVTEFAQRQGGETQRKVLDAALHFKSFLPRDGDIEGALRNKDTMAEIREGFMFLINELRVNGVLVEQALTESTGLECEFFETHGKWYYALQDWDCPVGCWDWREYATCYGPFDDYETCHEHLRVNHANPGGHSITNYGDKPLDEATAQLVKDAKNPAKDDPSGWSYRY